MYAIVEVVQQTPSYQLVQTIHVAIQAPTLTHAVLQKDVVTVAEIIAEPMEVLTMVLVLLAHVAVAA